MITSKKLIISKDFKKNEQLMSLFGYQLIKRKSLFFGQYNYVKYEKESPTPKLDLLEKEYSPRNTVPLFICVFFLFASICLATTYLILSLLLKPNFDKGFYFLILMLPCLLSLLVGSALMMWRYLAVMRNIQVYGSIFDIETKIKEIL